MKRLFILALLVVFTFTFSGCSLPNGMASSKDTGDNGAARGKSPDTAAITDGQDPGSAVEDDLPSKADGGDQNEEANTKTISVVLYFPTKDNSTLKKEERDILVADGAILKACILALAEGPETKGLHNPIPEGTEIRGISIKNKVAVVDLSQEFMHTSGLQEITARMSIVNTLTGISGVEKVRFHIEGEDMIGPSGLPLGDMEPATLDEDGALEDSEMITVTLYFSDSNAMYVVSEKRDVMTAKNDSPERQIIHELIEGPMTDDLWSAIPDGTKLLSANTKDGLCTVDLSKEFVDNSPGGTASERMAIYSIVNSLTELETVERVQFLIEGEKREIYTHAIFDEPFYRNTELIAK